MPRTKGVNKAQAVRDYLRDHPRAKSREIVEALAKQGMKITIVYVARVKGMRKKLGRPPGKAVASSRPVGMPEIKAALALIRVCGGILAAKEALAAATELKALV